MDEPRRQVALALGSGVAIGYAHIGVIEVLEERGFESDVRTLDFQRAESMIELGRDAATRALEEAGLGD